MCHVANLYSVFFFQLCLSFQSSFGVSNFLLDTVAGVAVTVAKSDVEADCKTDFLVVNTFDISSALTEK